MNDFGDSHHPVTVSIARRIRPGREADYEAWISGVTTVAAGYPGYQGVQVLRPAAATDHAYVLIYRFDTEAHSRAWDDSPDRAAWVEKLGSLVEGEPMVKRVTGLEFWFDLPEVPATAKPSPHKMALVVLVVVYATVYTLNLLLGPLVAGLPVWLRVLVFVALQVVLMTYVVMPRVTRLLRGWLYRS